MKTSQKVKKTKMEISILINSIAPEKLDRALYILEYMVNPSTTTQDRKSMSEYVANDEVTLDMLVEMVKIRQTPSLSGVAI